MLFAFFAVNQQPHPQLKTQRKIVSPAVNAPCRGCKIVRSGLLYRCEFKRLNTVRSTANSPLGNEFIVRNEVRPLVSDRFVAAGQDVLQKKKAQRHGRVQIDNTYTRRLQIYTSPQPARLSEL